MIVRTRVEEGKVLPRVATLLRKTIDDWSEDHVPRRAAALAFYAGFSLAPLLLIAISIGGIAFGADAVRGRVLEQLRGLLGVDAARAVETVLKNTRVAGSSLVVTAFGLAALLVGASGVFGELQDSLNAIWKVARKSARGWRGVIRDRLFSFTLVLGTGFLLLVSLLVSAALEAALALVSDWIRYPTLLRMVSLVASFAVICVMFAIMFRVMPDARTRWRDVWLGAAMTAVLFSVGKSLIGLYLGHSALASTYGAAGSFVVLLMWLYYSCQVILLGAEFTHAFAGTFGEPPVPKEYAVPVDCIPVSGPDAGQGREGPPSPPRG
jgi:membrane protein